MMVLLYPFSNVERYSLKLCSLMTVILFVCQVSVNRDVLALNYQFSAFSIIIHLRVMKVVEATPITGGRFSTELLSLSAGTFFYNVCRTAHREDKTPRPPDNCFYYTLCFFLT